MLESSVRFYEGRRRMVLIAQYLLSYSTLLLHLGLKSGTGSRVAMYHSELESECPLPPAASKTLGGSATMPSRASFHRPSVARHERTSTLQPSLSHTTGGCDCVVGVRGAVRKIGEGNRGGGRAKPHSLGLEAQDSLKMGSISRTHPGESRCSAATVSGISWMP